MGGRDRSEYSPQLEGSRMVREVDWLMNEHPDPEKLLEIRKTVGPGPRLIQCVCGWGDQHNANAVLTDPNLQDVGIYGFAKPDPETTLPPKTIPATPATSPPCARPSAGAE